MVTFVASWSRVWRRRFAGFCDCNVLECFAGDDCGVTQDCNGHGQCTDGLCYCTTPCFAGPECGVANTCSNRGSCSLGTIVLPCRSVCGGRVGARSHSLIHSPTHASLAYIHARTHLCQQQRMGAHAATRATLAMTASTRRTAMATASVTASTGSATATPTFLAQTARTTPLPALAWVQVESLPSSWSSWCWLARASWCTVRRSRADGFGMALARGQRQASGSHCRQRAA